MSRRYILRNREILTPEAVRAILAKQLLFKANNPREQQEVNLITAIGAAYYATCKYCKPSDSANQHLSDDSALLTMLASEAVLRREWDTPEEDEAWANLLKVK
jgi:hypothetical protein